MLDPAIDLSLVNFLTFIRSFRFQITSDTENRILVHSLDASCSSALHPVVSLCVSLKRAVMASMMR